jgi:ornithine decarboxylase
MFKEHFLPNDPRGVIAPAIKATSRNRVLEIIHAAGHTTFECAFPSEAERVLGLGEDINIMSTNPIKTREDIKAFAIKGAKYFTADDMAEADLILEETKGLVPQNELTIALREKTNNDHGAAIDLSSKFGAPEEEIRAIAEHIRRNTQAKIGITIHLGSQNVQPSSYINAIGELQQFAKSLGGIESVNLGGGFPIEVHGQPKPPGIEVFLDGITQAMQGISDQVFKVVIIEPGRSIVSPASLIMPVLKVRRGNGTKFVYIPDGPFMSFNPADSPNHNAQFQVMRRNGTGAFKIVDSQVTEQFTIFDNSCDSEGKLNGERVLPGDIQKGDYLLHTNAGAYTDAYSVAPGCYSHFGYNGAPHPKWISYNLLSNTNNDE